MFKFECKEMIRAMPAIVLQKSRLPEPALLANSTYFIKEPYVKFTRCQNNVLPAPPLIQRPACICVFPVNSSRSIHLDEATLIFT